MVKALPDASLYRRQSGFLFKCCGTSFLCRFLAKILGDLAKISVAELGPVYRSENALAGRVEAQACLRLETKLVAQLRIDVCKENLAVSSFENDLAAARIERGYSDVYVIVVGVGVDRDQGLLLIKASKLQETFRHTGKNLRVGTPPATDHKVVNASALAALGLTILLASKLGEQGWL
ncbi:hypothetical protein A9D12_10180 [Erythrobacter neustonensis]|uniref:Uncharacterized protein n=1 Tax=Erythrobacter neustonensis TaxID=1112 RepID=A0A192D446_9SPHN|nr:hypothetical protein A9D12_10180 [Erythrobacter neustonensis]